MNELTRINFELHRLFDIFNAELFNNEVQRPVIVAQTNGRDSGVMGWCTMQKVWTGTEDKEQAYYEITLCAEYLYMNIEEICGTLIHEMVHLYCVQNGIKDTSRGCTYHNKRFKDEAEKRGLIISYDKRIGWSLTKLTDETKKLVTDKADATAFTMTRIGNRGKATPPKNPKSSTRKYVCPECGAIIRATKEVNVICEDCQVKFEQVA